MEEKTQFLILLLQGESFAIPITSLLEITVPRNIQKDQKLSEIFEGKFDYRGKLIPVVNLKEILKLPGNPGGGLLVVKSIKGVLGLLVDAAKELLETTQMSIPMPRGVLSSSLDYYAGILRNESYAHRDATCPFCEIGQDRIIGQNELAYAIRDGYPVTHHHSLIIPKRHVATYFELGQAEINACTSLMQDVRKEVSSLDPTVDGFNVGINTGSTAGQTVPHCHIHLIPRRVGDVADPIGGVRNVIPGKGNYKVHSGSGLIR